MKCHSHEVLLIGGFLTFFWKEEAKNIINTADIKGKLTATIYVMFMRCFASIDCYTSQLWTVIVFFRWGDGNSERWSLAQAIQLVCRRGGGWAPAGQAVVVSVTTLQDTFDERKAYIWLEVRTSWFIKAGRHQKGSSGYSNIFSPNSRKPFAGGGFRSSCSLFWKQEGGLVISPDLAIPGLWL